MPEVTEVPFSRERFGNDRTAINRHSTRQYVSASGSRYLLDRTLDTLPPFFALYALVATPSALAPGLGEVVKVDGADYWGNGLPWQQAEKIALAAIETEEAKTDA